MNGTSSGSQYKQSSRKLSHTNQNLPFGCVFGSLFGVPRETLPSVCLVLGFAAVAMAQQRSTRIVPPDARLLFPSISRITEIRSIFRIHCGAASAANQTPSMPQSMARENYFPLQGESTARWWWCVRFNCEPLLWAPRSRLPNEENKLPQLGGGICV